MSTSSAPDTNAPPRAARWPWVCLALFLSIAIVGMIATVVNDAPLGEQVPFVIAFTMFGLVGALIVSRDRRNVIGIMLLWASLCTACAFAASELSMWAIDAGHGGPVVVFVALMTNFGWLFGILPVLFLLPLLFPDGHLPSRRWRPYLWFIVAFLAVIAVSLLFGQETLTGSTEAASIPNPFYVDAIGSLPSLDPVIGVLYPVLLLVSVSSLILRFRRSSGVERQQIKWVGFGFLAAFVGIFVSEFLTDPTVNAIVGGAAFLVFPVSIGIAVLRFHLYDLDVVVKKAVVYAALALFATVVYLGLVVGIGAWLGQGSSFLTMVAAVIVAVTFQPVRERLSRFANRLVYGKRATPYEVLTDFSERVGDAYEEIDVLPRMARVLGEGIGARRSDVWLAVGGEMRRVAVWPADTEPAAPVRLADGEIPPIEGIARVVPVEQAGELLGALGVRKPTSDPISPSDEKLIAGLASQAGLLMRNVRLTEELKAHLEELKAAQRRIVSAQDEERRRLERNIHDGAQQQLVALAVKLKLADALVDRDPAGAHGLMTQLQAETHDALEDLRDLARGIYPPLLADKGLVAALEAQARKAFVEVTVDGDGDWRGPEDVEAAAYFCCLEALQNMSKYAGASQAAVRIRHDDGMLAFEVTDDGAGFDTATTGYGTGLQGMADRLAAQGGALEITSKPGAGTKVRGRIPVEQAAAV